EPPISFALATEVTPSYLLLDGSGHHTPGSGRSFVTVGDCFARIDRGNCWLLLFGGGRGRWLCRIWGAHRQPHSPGSAGGSGGGVLLLGEIFSGQPDGSSLRLQTGRRRYR